MRVFHFPSTCSGCVQKFGFCVIYSLLLAPTHFFLIIFISEQLILFHFFKLTVHYLLCFTKCLSFSQHFCLFDAMFLSSGRMMSLFRFIASILLSRAECLNTLRVFQNRNSVSLERIFGIIPFILIPE